MEATKREPVLADPCIAMATAAILLVTLGGQFGTLIDYFLYLKLVV